ncbi:MAG: thioesterase family protein [Pseudomonadota bacterium]
MTDTHDMKPHLEQVREVYQKLPFNLLLGIKVSYLDTDGAGLEFPMKPELVGNPAHGILHGGVISAVLDTTGGITATASAICRMKNATMDDILFRVYHIGTIDMRVDYLRPGRGSHFYSSGTVMRTGNKVSVTRMELKNQDGLLIAVGTGSYIVG